MSELKDAARRVQERAAGLGLEIEVRQMPGSTRTAVDAAAACGCGVGQIVKSLVFKGRTSGKPYLLLVSGSNRVDEKGVAAVIGEPLTRPDAQFVRDVTGYAIGGIPPLGHDTPLATLLRSRPHAIRRGMGRSRNPGERIRRLPVAARRENRRNSDFDGLERDRLTWKRCRFHVSARSAALPRRVNRPLNSKCRAGFTLRPRHRDCGKVLQSEAALL
jgi:prolyl-tRNA editing enzyme YbaK/EbsC (Cys-tRNA(Pro) deacylase)